MSARRILEKLSRGKVLKRRILVNGTRVPICVSPDAQLKYLKFGHNAFDRDLIELAETNLNEHSKVWDVGANVGVFTFSAAAVAASGSVLAIEADVWLAGLLRRTTEFKDYIKRDIKICLPRFLIQILSRHSWLPKEAGPVMR